MNIKPGRLGVRRLLCLSIAMLMMVAAMSVDGMVVTGAAGSGDVVAAGDGGTGADALENDADLPSAAGFEELAVYDNSIGGTLWVDENADGVRDGDEQPLAGFVVRLYAEDDLTERVQAVPADENGQYRFENIEPGRYVVGIAAGYAGADKYEPAAADITGDNKFALSDNGENAYTEVIEVKEDSIITGLAAGLREIAGIMPTGTTLGYTVTGDGSINNVSYNTLQEAMADITSDNGTTYTITVSQDDPSMGAQVTIPAGKDITLTSSGGTRTITTAETQSAVTTFYGVRHFHINGGSLTLDNIILAGEFGYTSGTIANGGVSVVNSTDGSSGSLTMKNGSKITKCYNGQYGGGVAVSSSTFIMEDSEVSVNGCYQYGGGIFALLSTVTLGNNCVIDKNTALQNGGGMFLRQSTITMENDIKITNNKVTVATSTGQGVAGGGGIHLYQTDLHFTGGEISDNSSVRYGGGVSLNSNSNFTMSGGLITNNTAVDNGGGLYFNSGGTFEMNGGTISYNKAGNGGGVGFGNSSTLNAAGEFSMKEGAVITNNETTGDGGGICMHANTFTMDGGKFSENTAAGSGGGIFMRAAAENGSITINGGEISDNNAEEGAGIFTHEAEAKMTGTIISGNQATKSGGGWTVDNISVTSSTTRNHTITDVEITGNSAGNFGGGLYVLNGAVNMYGGKISNNTAAYGGGIYTGIAGVRPWSWSVTGGNKTARITGLVDGGEFSLYDGEISGNTADQDGGGVYLMFGRLYLYNGMLMNNTANQNGGGVYVTIRTLVRATSHDSISTAACAITGNTAGNDGGGIYTDRYDYSDPVTIADNYYDNVEIDSTITTFSGNTASKPYAPPANAQDVPYFDGELLNNDDINYQGNFAIKYVANNGTADVYYQNIGKGGTVALDPYSVMNFTPPTYFTFSQWTMQEDGSGTSYADGDSGTFNDSITLYAQYEAAEYNIIEQYVDESGNIIQAETKDTVLESDPKYTYSGGTANITNGTDVYIYQGYTWNSYTSGDTLLSGTPANETITNDTTVFFVYHKLSTGITVTFSTEPMEFYVDGDTWPNVETGPYGSTDQYYALINKSEAAIRVGFKQMKVEKNDGLNFVADASTSLPGSGEISIDLNVAPSGLLGGATNAFTAGVSNIIPDTVYNTPVVLGTLDGTYTHPSSAPISDKGYVTIGGHYADYLTGAGKYPELKFIFEYTLITE